MSAPSPRPTPEQAKEMQRASKYVGLFIGAEAQGHPWHYVAPVDGRRDGDVLHLGSARMERLDGRSWRVTVGETSHVLALREPTPAQGKETTGA